MATIHERRWRILAVLCLALLIVNVDNTIVNVALPSIARQLAASVSQLQWVVDAYTLLLAGLLLVGGSWGDRNGRRRALLIGLAVFAVGSAAATLSWLPEQLIASRAVMGTGTALVLPATLSLLSEVFADPAERGRAIGLWSATSGLAVAAGPSLGGVLLGHFWWGSVFVVNLPIVAVTVLLTLRWVPEFRAAHQVRLDLVGSVLSIAGVGLLVYGLIEAPGSGWGSATTILRLAGAAAVLAVFVVWELRAPAPLLDLSVFRRATFTLPSLAVTVVFFGLAGSLFLLTQQLQFVLGYSPLRAGLAALPFAGTLGAVAPLAPRLARRHGARATLSLGLTGMGAGLVVLAQASTDTGYPLLLAATVIMALGMGLVMAPATELIMSSLPRERAGVGSAVNDTSRQLGATLGVAVLGSLTASAYAVGLRQPAGSHASSSLSATLSTAATLPPGQAEELRRAATGAFLTAADGSVAIAAAVVFCCAVATVLGLRARQTVREDADVAS
ncbi:MFS transporter [Solihabitans fulvus]|uniref:MFS transporter n=1 Tax=Solihabitans fulvus TaxID=1892852 RepID=UPI001661C080|nr:MFS transporter [Solihabitans fulvus]